MLALTLGRLSKRSQVSQNRAALHKAVSGEASAIREEFVTLAAEYRDLKISDYAERFATRSRLADRLGTLVVAFDMDQTS